MGDQYCSGKSREPGICMAELVCFPEKAQSVRVKPTLQWRSSDVRET